MKRGISTIFWCALIAGIVFALSSYFGVVAPKSEWMRSIYINDVEHDNISAFCKRLMIGAGGGAIIGILLFIRARKKDDDDA